MVMGGGRMGRFASTVLPLEAWVVVSRGPLAAACVAMHVGAYGTASTLGVSDGGKLSSIRRSGALEGGKSDRQ